MAAARSTETLVSYQNTTRCHLNLHRHEHFKCRISLLQFSFVTHNFMHSFSSGIPFYSLLLCLCTWHYVPTEPFVSCSVCYSTSVTKPHQLQDLSDYHHCNCHPIIGVKMEIPSKYTAIPSLYRVGRDQDGQRPDRRHKSQRHHRLRTDHYHLLSHPSQFIIHSHIFIGLLLYNLCCWRSVFK